jgi:hypothetical protein
MLGLSAFGRQGDEKPFEEPEAEYAPYRRYVEKLLLPVVIYMSNCRVEGVMHVTYHHRALDILNGPETFLPVTQARIFRDLSNELICTQEFVAVAKSQIVCLYETGKAVEPMSVESDEEEEASEESTESGDESAESSEATDESAESSEPAKESSE